MLEEKKMSLISKMDLLNKRRVAWIDGLKTTYVTTSDIFDAPEIDAAPVVHAQFKKSIERDEWWGYIYVCSECGAEMMVYNA